MPSPGARVPEPRIERVDEAPDRSGAHVLRVRTDRGAVEARWYEAPHSDRAVLLVGGAGGGFDSPAHGLYEKLARELPPLGLGVLRVRYRVATDLDEAVHDVLAGLRVLAGRGAKRVALVGHSFGGAVVIRAGAASPLVTAVVAIATQSHGAEPARHLAPKPLLLIHGDEDPVLPARCSLMAFHLAGEPKELRVFQGAGHCLDEASVEVFDLVHEWLVEKLPARRVEPPVTPPSAPR